MFIVTNDPTQFKDTALRKKARSHAAFSSADARKKTIAEKNGSDTASIVLPSPDSTTSSLSTDSSGTLTGSGSANMETATEAVVRRHDHSPSTRSHTLSTSELNPIWSYPTNGVWHEEIPRLVQTYLDLLAPIASDSDCPSRMIIRHELWPQALSNSSLFFGCLLIAAVQPPHYCDNSNYHELEDWLRYMAIKCINKTLNTLDEGVPDDVAICAVGLLAGWELEYGDHALYETHSKGIKTMLAMRGGFEEANLSSITRQIVLSVLHDRALYAGKLVLCASPSTTSSPTEDRPDPATLSLPQGFQSLKQSRLLLPGILDLVSRLHNLTTTDQLTELSLCKIYLALKEHDTGAQLAVPYCPVQSYLDDEVNYQAERHIRLAALCYAHRLRLRLAGILKPMIFDGVNALSQLKPSYLLGTVYADVCAWALFIIYASVGKSDAGLESALRSVVEELGLLDGESWEAVKRLLSRFLYSSEVYEGMVKRVWRRVLLLPDREEEKDRMRTRYDVGVFKAKTVTSMEHTGAI